MSRTLTFKDLMAQVDEDYDAIGVTEHRRRLLYYSVKLDDRITSIIARSTLNQSNRPRLTFFIRTQQRDSTYTMLYLSEVDIISILSTLDDTLYRHIIDHLVKVYRNEIDIDVHKANFSRGSLIGSKIKEASITADLEVVVVPEHESSQGVDTPFGYQISFQSLCDDISLMLSTENRGKLKTVIAKYYVLSSLVRGAPSGMPVPPDLARMTTISDIADEYRKKAFTKAQRYDARVFSSRIFDDYFKSLA